MPTKPKKRRTGGQECVYCRKALRPAQAYVRAQLHRQKVLGGGADRDRRFHVPCFVSFERKGQRLADSELVWEVMDVEFVAVP